MTPAAAIRGFLTAAALGLAAAYPAGGQAPAGPWLKTARGHHVVFYQAGFESDTTFAHKWADRADQLMRTKYGVTPDHYRLEILMSEYIPIGHYEVQSARPSGGWRYYDAPNWFVQGLQKYDAIFHTTDVNRDTTGKRLFAWAAANPGVFTCCNPEVAISDAYNGGASFVAFLAAQFGEDMHARLLRSPAATFSDALTEVTKPYTRPQLFDLLQQWRAKGGR